MSHLDGSRKFFVLIASLTLLIACSGPQSRPEGATTADQTPPMDSLVTTEWLGQHLNDPDLVVLDCTVRVERGEDGGFQIFASK